MYVAGVGSLGCHLGGAAPLRASVGTRVVRHTSGSRLPRAWDVSCVGGRPPSGGAALALCATRLGASSGRGGANPSNISQPSPRAVARLSPRNGPAQTRHTISTCTLPSLRTNCPELLRGSRCRRLTSPMALRVLVLLLAHCAARPAPPRSLTLSGGAKKKAIKHGKLRDRRDAGSTAERRGFTRSTEHDRLICAQASATGSTPSTSASRATPATWPSRN